MRAALYEAVRTIRLVDGRFKTAGIVSDVIPLADVVERGFERLAADRSLVKVVVRP